jgi:hypothetical protein
MKFNKWTLSLAALGVVSLASAVRADEKAAPTYLETAVSGTSISGYVNTSAQWNVGNNGQLPGYGYGQSDNASKADGFNIDAVEVTISKQLDDSQWASGYTFTSVYGQDAAAVGRGFAESSGSDSFGATIKDAYVELRTPVGNGIDWKVGVFDTLLGYEVFDADGNPNYTRSYGYQLEPTTHTGVLTAYNVTDWLSVQLGVGNTTIDSNAAYDRNGTGYYGAGNNSTIESKKAYYASVSLTAPNSWGFLAGSTLYGAVEGGRPSGAASGATGGYADQINYYGGVVINTPVKGLKFGGAYDYVGYSQNTPGVGGVIGDAWADALAAYVTYQATDKLSFDGRAEYAWESATMAATPTGAWYTPTAGSGTVGGCESAYALTGTVEYDLWKNVMSRAEIRWDSVKDDAFGNTGDKKDSVLIAANIIYKF